MFHLGARATPVWLEARDGFKIIGPLLLRCPEGEVAARYAGECWCIGGRQATRFECAQRASLRFSNSSDDESWLLGPFDHVSFPNGYCYADQILIAELVTTTERWRHCETGLRWRAILISAV